jgi:hypothetical protein
MGSSIAFRYSKNVDYKGSTVGHSKHLSSNPIFIMKNRSIISLPQPQPTSSSQLLHKAFQIFIFSDLRPIVVLISF